MSTIFFIMAYQIKISSQNEVLTVDLNTNWRVKLTVNEWSSNISTWTIFSTLIVSTFTHLSTWIKFLGEAYTKIRRWNIVYYLI